VHGDDGGATAAQLDLLATVPDAVYHLDRDWQITYLNAAVEALVRRRAEDLLGQDLFEVFPALRGTELESELAAVLADGKPRSFEYLYEPMERWYEVRAFADALGLAVFLRDVEAERRVRGEQAEEIRRLSSVLDALPPPTVLLDPEGRILTVNRIWAESADADVVRMEGFRVGRVGDDYLQVMAQVLDAADRDRIADGLRGLLAGSAPAVVCDYQATYGVTRRPCSGRPPTTT
jgi:PAS domain-containing protein